LVKNLARQKGAKAEGKWFVANFSQGGRGSVAGKGPHRSEFKTPFPAHGVGKESKGGAFRPGRKRFRKNFPHLGPEESSPCSASSVPKSREFQGWDESLCRGLDPGLPAFTICISRKSVTKTRVPLSWFFFFKKKPGGDRMRFEKLGMVLFQVAKAVGAGGRF